MIASPIITIFFVSILALALGVTTSFYTVFQAVFEVRRIRDIEQVVNIYRVGPGDAMWRSDFEYLQGRQTVLADLISMSRVWSVLTIGTKPAELVAGEVVDGGYFHFAGVEALLGRVLQPADDRPGHPPVAVISFALWQRLFNGDENIIGRTITLSGYPLEVVGVMPRDFPGLISNVSPTAFWSTLSFVAVTRSDTPLRVDQLATFPGNVKGRLKPGETLERAASELQLLGSQLDRDAPRPPSEYPERYNTKRIFVVRAANSVRMSEIMDVSVLPVGKVVVTIVAIVFVIACTNLSILIFARQSIRHHEWAVRSALGASGTRLMCEEFLERTLLVLAGVIGGVVVTALVTKSLTTLVRDWSGFTADFVTDPSRSAGAFAIQIVIALGLLAVLPAFRTKRMSTGLPAAESISVGGSGRWALQRLLIVIQVSVSFVLIAVATLCTRQLAAVGKPNVGIDLDRLALVQLNTRQQRIPRPRARRDLEEILEFTKRLPAVDDACLVSGLPFGRTFSSVGRVTSLDRPFLGEFFEGHETIQLVSTPEVFRTLGVVIRRGRAFDTRDLPGAEPVAVVSELTARKILGGADVVGRQILFRPLSWAGEPPAKTQKLTIVGVASDTDTQNVGQRDTAVVYLPLSQNDDGTMTVVARTTAEPQRLVELIRHAVWQVNPDLAAFAAGTGQSLAEAGGLLLLNAAALTGLLGAAAICLTMVGLSGTLLHAVARRRQEIGIRMALGATQQKIVTMVMLDGVQPVVGGVLVGLVGSTIATLGLQPLFVTYLPTVNPLLLATIPIPLLIIAGLSCYLPAKRAAQTTPNLTLKER